MANDPSVRILIVDDHPIVRLGIRQLVAADPRLAVCAEACSAEEALRAVTQLRPDLALVDLSLGDAAGLELVRLLLGHAPALRILVLSMHDEALFAERALRAGARGYIMKHEAISGLLNAIHEVHAGRLYVSGRMSQQILQRVKRDDPGAGRLGNLSDRELEVLELIGRGQSTTAIAERLGISIKTIETYRSNIKTKLDLKDASELIRFATAWTERL